MEVCYGIDGADCVFKGLGVGDLTVSGSGGI